MVQRKYKITLSGRSHRSFISGVEEAAYLPVEQTHDRTHICVGCGLVQIAAQKREKIRNILPV
jgi:hypothetical protein